MEFNGKVFVVSGPSGAGKDTLIRKALTGLDSLYYSISATTRKPREGEVDGVDYHFLANAEFDRLVECEGLLEWEQVFGARYGTPTSEVDRAAAAGRDLLLELDVKGALQVKSKIADAVLIFIMPPSLKVLEERLRDRNKNQKHDLEVRAELAPWEIEVGKGRFDVLIVNEDADKAAEELARVFRGE